jgi:hypothetical protein
MRACQRTGYGTAHTLRRERESLATTVWIFIQPSSLRPRDFLETSSPAQVLDRYFGNVCELDLIFNFHKVSTCGFRLVDSKHAG